MLIDVCLGTRTAWKILLVLSEAPGKAVSRKEIQKLTKTGNKALSKFLLLLVKFSIITSSKVGKACYYKMNLSSPFAVQILEIVKTEKSQLNAPDFFVLNILREFVYELTNINLENLNRVILFGSYAKRTQGKDSDIDIAIILKKNDANSELLITELIEKLKNRFKKEIQPHYYAEADFDRLSRKKGLEQEIIKDGIMLM
ncbi:MAG: nucleotidyltransferase domain-containing protein [Candidatus Woesearchaeota archaeon]